MEWYDIVGIILCCFACGFAGICIGKEAQEKADNDYIAELYKEICRLMDKEEEE